MTVKQVNLRGEMDIIHEDLAKPARQLDEHLCQSFREPAPAVMPHTWCSGSNEPICILTLLIPLILTLLMAL